jgi:hypothetical protein
MACYASPSFDPDPADGLKAVTGNDFGRRRYWVIKKAQTKIQCGRYNLAGSDPNSIMGSRGPSCPCDTSDPGSWRSPLALDITDTRMGVPTAIPFCSWLPTAPIQIRRRLESGRAWISKSNLRDSVG